MAWLIASKKSGSNSSFSGRLWIISSSSSFLNLGSSIALAALTDCDNTSKFSRWYSADLGDARAIARSSHFLSEGFSSRLVNETHNLYPALDSTFLGISFIQLTHWDNILFLDSGSITSLTLGNVSRMQAIFFS